MISNPTPQRALRPSRPVRLAPRVANSAEHQARLARRLTSRDLWLAWMLHEHRVLTSHQLTALAFPSFRSGRQRLRELYLWSVLDRFQPLAAKGTAPLHYVLGPAGATALAAHAGLEVKHLGYRHDRAMAIAHSLQLAHTVGVNEWFTALIAAAPTTGIRVEAWWSQARCGRYFGDLVRPDAYGRVHHTRPTTGSITSRSAGGSGVGVEFFLEYDFGTEALTRVADKLHGYANLAAATGIATPVLIWLPTSRRETNARRALTATLQRLDHPHTVPVATAAADLLDPRASHPSPADPVWLPLETTDPLARRPLHRLLAAWPHLPPPPAKRPEPLQAPRTASPEELPAPCPTPPARDTVGQRC